MKLDRVIVIGGSGFIGRHVVAALVRRGIKVTVPARRRERAKHLILLPTVDVIEVDVGAAGALERLVRGHDAVINLVGVLHGPDFDKAHVELPRAIVAACRAAGVKRLVHLSALGAAADAPSAYQRSKAKGEEEVMGATDLEVTVFRPSVVFGPEDKFLNRFASLARFSPVFAVPCPTARFQPVYVGDVAAAIVASLSEPAAHGRRYDLAGPREYTLKELVRCACEFTGRHRLVIGLPQGLSSVQAWMLEKLPGELMSRDNVRSMKVANTTRAAFPFGIQPQALEAVAPAYLAPSGPRERYPQLRFRARR
ncbi:MAG TPA: complex I NDUFA9 subunit family protein [Burkholderiales bacterium]|nr:complex I NDUFA9 subunit family protein [Burkholderiales bacterium]